MFARIHGNVIATIAFVLWGGLLPLYFQFLPQADTNELIAMRIIFSVPLMLLILKCLKIPNLSFTQAMKNKQSLCLCFIAGILNCISLYAFTWAITNDQVLAASLVILSIHCSPSPLVCCFLKIGSLGRKRRRWYLPFAVLLIRSTSMVNCLGFHSSWAAFLPFTD